MTESDVILNVDLRKMSPFSLSKYFSLYFIHILIYINIFWIIIYILRIIKENFNFIFFSCETGHFNPDQISMRLKFHEKSVFKQS